MLIIRADGNAKIGAGHMMRCLTIAEAARQEETGILFLCADEDSAQMARDHGFPAKALKTDYREMEAEAWPISGTDHTILVDSYYVTDVYLEKLHAYGRVFLMDDLQNHGYPVDVVINYNAFADPEVYRRLYPESPQGYARGTGTECFLGARYVPLRRQFEKTRYDVRDEVRQVLLTTGGGDVDNIAGQILDVVYEPEMTYHVLVGRFSPHFQEWTRKAAETKNLEIHYDVRDMAGLMEQCDLAITAGGSTVYELAAVGVPFLCFSYAANQEALVDYIGVNRIAGSAGAWHKGPEHCRERIRQLWRQLCDCYELRTKYYIAEKKLTDGQGAMRLAGILSKAGERLCETS